MNWTEQQRKAIECRDKNILVAAAAGSGKTAVLVERIRRLIIEDRVPVDRMLIVTFTNAAAAEMKEKIRTALYNEQEGDRTKAVYARRQLALLPQANISTFHSFALSVIRKYFYLTDLEPGFSICDEARGTILKEDAMDELMEKRFSEGSPEFYDFLDHYSSGKNTDNVKEMVASAYNTVMAMPYPWKWMEEKAAELALTPEEFEKTALMESVWKYAEESVKQALTLSERAVEILKEKELDRLAEKVQKGQTDYLKACEIEIDARDFNALMDTLNQVTSPRTTPNKKESLKYEDVKTQVSDCVKGATEAVKGIREELFSDTLENQVLEMNETAPYAEYLMGMVKEFHELFKAAKRKKKLVDFSDIEHYCLEILDNEEAAGFYREKFKAIFIDEYQDTNVLQEEIIGRIKGPDNLFMVGDIKQSIYRFRLAEPSIFRKKYLDYGGEDENSIRIDLNKNYRSKSEVLEGINKVFRKAMADYDADAELYPGIDYEGELNYRPEMYVLDFAPKGDEEEPEAGRGETDKAVTEEIAELKKTEVEALQAANLIRQALGKEYYDAKTGKVRRLRRRDIVILLRSVRNYAEVYQSILKRCDIDSFVDDNEGYFDTMEIQVFMNLLSVIDNKKQDMPLISLLHSEIFGFTADDLAEIRTGHKEGTYEEALRAFAEENAESELGNRCGEALRSIEGWKAESSIMPLGRFIWKLLTDTGYYIVMGAMPGGSQRQANLRALVDKAEEFASDGQGSLYGFMRYIDSVKKRKVRTGQVRLIGEKDDVVRIMTIHKSKGLEFPMVILANCGVGLNYTKIGRGAAFHKEVGIGLTLENPKERWHKQTLVQKLIKKAVRKEEAEEEVRVLYVALTRAKDFLYVLGSVKSGVDYLEARINGVFKDTDYLSMIGSTMPYRLIYAADVDRGALSDRVYRRGDILKSDIYSGKLSDEERNEILERLSFQYPHRQARELKPKYSVSELNAGAEKDDKSVEAERLGPESEEPRKPVYTDEAELRVPKFMAGKTGLSAAARGTIFHTLMENLDFTKADAGGYDYIAAEVERLKEEGIFTEEEAESINIDGAAEFFESETGKRAAGAFARGELKKEKPFTAQTEMNGETVMVQGIIDCFFTEGDRVVLVDYKTNYIDKTKTIEEEAKRIGSMYKEQVRIYRDTLMKATGASECKAYLYLVQTGTFVGMNE